MEFRIEMDKLMFIVADAPEQRRDFETKSLRTNDDGEPLFTARLLVMDGLGSAPIKVGLIGDPGLSQGTFVRPVGLVLNAIDRKGDSVQWWTAERLEAVAMPGGPAGGSAASGKSAGKAGE
ncbi:hypothetical protein [Actinomadura violacea]|uniref:Regulatory protein n=1 Tax=Actinomadura violacea TaxID=2819934 RepID=A0ABS3RR71_9ACTN|nr:hypothetical protein [Actinomadura violacea]MBO2459245.1 hypothetical protein [Actinomadura violacea]